MRIDRNSLLPLLAHAAECADKRDSITACVRLDCTDSAVTVTATDHEVSGTACAPCDGDGEWSLCVPAATLLRQIASLPDGATVSLSAGDNARLQIAAGRSKYEIAGKPAGEFPEVPAPPEGGVALDSEALRQLLARTAYCVSQDDSRPAIAGLYLRGDGETLTAVATDGHRLALATMPAPGLTVDAIMHRRGLSVLRRMLDSAPTVWLAMDGRNLVWRTRDLSATCRMVEANFPDYTKVIPDTANSKLHATFDAEAMLAELARCAPIMPRSDAIVRLTWEGDGLHLDGTGDLGDAHCELECEAAGAGTIGVNPTFLRDACKALGGTVTLVGKDGFNPLVLTSDAAAGAVVILMPMRIQGV